MNASLKRCPLCETWRWRNTHQLYPAKFRNSCQRSFNTKTPFSASAVVFWVLSVLQIGSILQQHLKDYQPCLSSTVLNSFAEIELFLSSNHQLIVSLDLSIQHIGPRWNISSLCDDGLAWNSGQTHQSTCDCFFSIQRQADIFAFSEISWQPLDEFPWNWLQMCMVPRWHILSFIHFIFL